MPLQSTPRCRSALRSLRLVPHSHQDKTNFERAHSCPLQKVSPTKLRIPPCSGFHQQCNSPEFGAALVCSKQRKNCSVCSAEKITAKDNNFLSCMPHRSHSALPIVDHNQDERKSSSSSLEDQPTTSSSDISVFPISDTEMNYNEVDKMRKMCTCSNPNAYRTNRSFLNQGQLLQMVCNRFSADESPDNLAQCPKSKNAVYLNRKKLQVPYKHSAPTPPHSQSSPCIPKCFPHSCCKNLGSYMPPIPKTSGKEYHNSQNLRKFIALEKSLKREISRIEKPSKVKSQPNIFNSSEPYYDTSLVKYMREHPHGLQPGYRSRRTALGMCDPAENLKLDMYMTPNVSVKTLKKIQDSYKKMKKSSERRSPTNPSSTSLQTVPVGCLESQNLAKRRVTFNHVPMSRTEPQQKHTGAKKKYPPDYQRTEEDFYTFELNQLNKMHPDNMANLQASYYTHILSKLGSRKAFYEWVQKQTLK